MLPFYCICNSTTQLQIIKRFAHLLPDYIDQVYARSSVRSERTMMIGSRHIRVDI